MKRVRRMIFLLSAGFALSILTAWGLCLMGLLVAGAVTHESGDDAVQEEITTLWEAYHGPATYIDLGKEFVQRPSATRFSQTNLQQLLPSVTKPYVSLTAISVRRIGYDRLQVLDARRPVSVGAMRIRAGWPLKCIECEHELDYPQFIVPNDSCYQISETIRSLSIFKSRSFAQTDIHLPINLRWFELTLNTVVFAILLTIPGFARRWWRRHHNRCVGRMQLQFMWH